MTAPHTSSVSCCPSVAYNPSSIVGIAVRTNTHYRRFTNPTSWRADTVAHLELRASCVSVESRDTWRDALFSLPPRLRRTKYQQCITTPLLNPNRSSCLFALAHLLSIFLSCHSLRLASSPKSSVAHDTIPGSSGPGRTSPRASPAGRASSLSARRSPPPHRCPHHRPPPRRHRGRVDDRHQGQAYLLNLRD
jgi:hypothetical protein